MFDIRLEANINTSTRNKRKKHQIVERIHFILINLEHKLYCGTLAISFLIIVNIDSVLLKLLNFLIKFHKIIIFQNKVQIDV